MINVTAINVALSSSEVLVILLPKLLPKSHTSYEDDKLFPFFANLLPEGTLRRVVCREHHIDENDLFGILSAMSGVDTIGAISLKTIDDERR